MWDSFSKMARDFLVFWWLSAGGRGFQADLLTSRWDLETIQHLLDLGRIRWGRRILEAWQIGSLHPVLPSLPEHVNI